MADRGASAVAQEKPPPTAAPPPAERSSTQPPPTVVPTEDTAGQRVQFHVNEGYTELRAGNVREAIAAFEHAIEAEPRDHRARFGLGTALISAGEFVRARDVLEALVRDFPDDYTVKNNLAWLYATAPDLRVRDGKKALAYAQEAVLLAPQDYHVWSTLAEAYYVNENYEQALRAAMEALRLVRETTKETDLHKEYERQTEKCRLAVQALSILE
jgi:Flp pilus assembly protein TadD